MDTVISLVATIVTMAIGGVITWLVAIRYYSKASDDLLKEATNLRIAVTDTTQEVTQVRRLVNVLARSLDSAGAIRATFSEDGDLQGFALPTATEHYSVTDRVKERWEEIIEYPEGYQPPES